MKTSSRNDHWNGRPVNLARMLKDLPPPAKGATPAMVHRALASARKNPTIHTEARRILARLQEQGKLTPERLAIARQFSRAAPAQRTEGLSVTTLRICRAVRAISRRDIQRASKRLGIKRNMVAVAEGLPRQV